MKPKISVITISYNSETTIEKTILSVIEQDYDNLQYIIIDGASQDRTVDIIKKYADKIAYWSSEPDKGISDAFNKGINVATGDIIGIVNSDDQYLPGALERVAQSYENGIDVYRGSILIHDEFNNCEYTYEPSMIFGMFPVYVNVCHLPTFITKEAYEKYGMYSMDFRLAMDLDLLRRFYRRGAKFKKVDAVLGQFNVGGISTAAGEKKGFDERRKVVLNNGGTIVHIWIYDCMLLGVRCMKFICSKILKRDYRSVRYQKKEDPYESNE